MEKTWVIDLLRRGTEVWVVDLPGTGELRHPSSSKELGDWKTFYLAYLLDQSLVGMRTEAVLNLAALMASESGENESPLHYFGDREAAVTLLHAAIVERQFVLLMTDQIEEPWTNVCRDHEPETQLTLTIHGVLMYYDSPDLRQVLK